MGQLHAFPTGKMTPEAVLEFVREAKCESIIVLGRDSDGVVSMWSTEDDKAEMLWHLRKAEQVILE